MEQPITIRFRWTADGLPQAYRYHFRHTCRPVFRFGLNFIFAFSVLCGVLLLTVSGPDGKAPLPISLGCLVVGIYWFAIRPFERRWKIRRQFRKRPDQDIEVEWQVDSDKLFTRSALGHSEVLWQSFAKVERTPEGVLLYPNDQIFH